MMDTEELYNALNVSMEPGEKRGLLIRYLKSKLLDLPADAESRRRVAYDIAGLMSTEYVLSLQDGDPLEAVFTIAGELEIDDVPADAAGWDELKRVFAEL